jgi:hypothetical protein
MGQFDNPKFNDFIVQIALLGDAPIIKGKVTVTLHYLSLGISNLLVHLRVQKQLSHIPKQTQRQIHSKFNI